MKLNKTALVQVGLANAGVVPLIVQGLRHADTDARECAAAAVGNFAAGYPGYSDGETKAAIPDMLAKAIPGLVKLCQKAKSGPADECAGEAKCCVKEWSTREELEVARANKIFPKRKMPNA